MKILVVAPDIEDPNYRGIQMVFLNLIETLCDLGHSLDLVVGYTVPRAKDLSPSLQEKLKNVLLRQYLSGEAELSLYKQSLRNFTLTLKGIARMCLPIIDRFELNKDERHQDIPWLKTIDHIVRIPYLYRLMRMNIYWFTQKVLKKALRKFKYDIVLAVSPLDLSQLKNKAKIVQFVHDFMPLELSEDLPDEKHRTQVARSLQKAIGCSDLLLTNSEDTKGKIQQVSAQARTEVLFYYTDIKPTNEKESILSQSVLNSYDLQSGEYLFFVSALEKRKNLERLIDAYAAIASDIRRPLVIAGKAGYGYKKLKEKVNALPPIIKDNILFLGYISSLQKKILLSHAFAFVFPSLYEGIGIPVLEAFTMNCPVITSITGGIKEIAGNAVIAIKNPYNTAEIADAILELENSPEMRETLIARGNDQVQSFSQDKYKERLASTLQALT